jgi:probable HAF family extracellular repeat protein
MPFVLILSDPLDPGQTFATGINNNGQIVGYYGQQSGLGSLPGFLDTGGNFTNLPDHQPQSINDAGHIVGSVQSGQASGGSGFFYNGTSYTTISDPNVSSPGFTYANGINNADQIVGYYTGNGLNPGTHGFLDTGGTYTDINDPLGVNGTFAEGINSLGQIVGHYTDVNNNTHGFLFSNGQYTTLDDPALNNRGTFAQAINRWGDIVGYYIDSGGQDRYSCAGHQRRGPDHRILSQPAIHDGTRLSFYTTAESAAARRHHRRHDPASCHRRPLRNLRHWQQPASCGRSIR